MKLNKKILAATLGLLFLGSVFVLKAEKYGEDLNTQFYFDAVAFKSDTPDSARIDFFVIAPYRILEFKQAQNTYVSSFDLTITLQDTLGKEVLKKTYNRSVAEKDYLVTRGGTGKFDLVNASMKVPNGAYKITAEISDKFSQKTLNKNRNITLINFDEFNCSMSGIMLVSSIEEKDGKLSITPHLNDNVGSLKDGFFAFFEVYNKTEYDSLDFSYVITDPKGTSIVESDGIRKYVGKGRSQVYLRLPKMQKFGPGVYILQIEAYKAGTDTVFKPENLLAVAKRSIKSSSSVAGAVLSDINKSIRQLRYVATSTEIDWINEPTSASEKEARFDAFWKKLDPTPNTEKNEALETYYSRIEFANNNFKSSREGWLTDRGITYIVYGPPLSVEKNSSPGITSTVSDEFETWYYASGMQFIFRKVGMDDYVFYKPMSVNEKFKYGERY